MKEWPFAKASLGIVLALLSWPVGGISQIIPLQNPSFEDFPEQGKPPFGWFFCGDMNETPPDVHPGGFYGVTTPAKDGQTYVGMVIRDNDTQEQIGQRLPQPLLSGQCYYLRIFAARSEQYASFSKKTRQPAQYTIPIKLAIVGARRHCEPAAVLALSDVVVDTKWQRLDLLLQPAENVDYLILRATSANGDAYNGNILLDAASPLVACDCKNVPAFGHPDLPPPGSPELESWMATQQAQIRFDGVKGVWDRELFESETGVLHYTNKPFWSLVQVLKKCTTGKLSIQYNPATLSESCRLEMETLLEASGLPKKRYTFKAKADLSVICQLVLTNVKA